MNHRPFEDWLINDRALTLAEKLQLDEHLRGCKSCTALVETGIELRSANWVLPRSGFTQRFQARLAAHKVAERRRRVLGAFVLILGGGLISGWLTEPYLSTLIASPAQWITLVISYLLFITSSIQTLTMAIRVIFNIAPDFLPAYIWMVMISIVAGLGLLWSVSIWRFTRHSQGVGS